MRFAVCGMLFAACIPIKNKNPSLVSERGLSNFPHGMLPGGMRQRRFTVPAQASGIFRRRTTEPGSRKSCTEPLSRKERKEPVSASIAGSRARSRFRANVAGLRARSRFRANVAGLRARSRFHARSARPRRGFRANVAGFRANVAGFRASALRLPQPQLLLT